ncbi:MAG: hypothetical protein NW207_04775 [Cytophagales bacterium]|nr:hypothetical protein [Cytophagales bacterium]
MQGVEDTLSNLINPVDEVFVKQEDGSRALVVKGSFDMQSILMLGVVILGVGIVIKKV